jgi:hypothetical protein
MDCVLSGMDRSDSEDADAPRWPFDRTLTLEIDPGMAEVPQALVAWSGR